MQAGKAGQGRVEFERGLREVASGRGQECTSRPEQRSLGSGNTCDLVLGSGCFCTEELCGLHTVGIQ